MKHFTVLAVVLMATSLAHGGDEADNRKAEVEWAKDVVTDFLKAVKAEEFGQARRLLTPELRREYNKDKIFLPAGAGIFLEPISWEFSKDEIAKIAPDKGEVVLRGMVYVRSGDKKAKGAFTIRVVKVKDTGLWRIDYLLVEEPPAKPKRK
jgi:hypothetical protein